jgi:hypothetical protein
MAEGIVVNNAQEVPFSYVLAELLESNLEQKPHKLMTFNRIFGVVAIDLKDIEATVTLIFSGGKVRLEHGIVGKPDIIIQTDSDKIIGLNSISIKFGLPYYFDEAGMNVIKQILSGELKIKGMLVHPIILTRLTKIMSVM